ncbi:MAG: polysaccharide biosynthesis/export family protein [Lentisphaeraceae bacterium]|nr:polysaccharide biosynthesis/export family protein [Lentisphaeraceae bacterium]
MAHQISMFLCTLLLGFTVLAQENVVLPVNDSTGENQLDDKKQERDYYRLNIGDFIKINVYGKEGSGRVVQIDNHGKFVYRYIGTVDAVGKTILELQADMDKKVKGIFRLGDVLVSPAAMQSQSFIIAGQVRRPGRKAINGKVSLLAAVASAGGFSMRSESGITTIELADLEHSFIIREGKQLAIDFTRLIRQGDMSQNIEVKSGEFIYVPDTANQKIYIMGEIVQPRHHEIRRQVTLMQVISHAGGPTVDASDEILIIRGSLTDPKVLRVPYSEILQGKRKDIFLKAKDLVYLPPRNFIFGEELIEAAFRGLILRMASEAGSETFDQINDSTLGNSNDSISGQ